LIIDTETGKTVQWSSLTSRVGTGNIDWLTNKKSFFFQGYYQENSNLYELSTDGSINEFPLISANNGYHYALSPNREEIAYSFDDEIWVQNIDGTALLQLTHNDTFDNSPDWSPNGEHLIFQSFREADRSYVIYHIDKDGNNSLALTESLKGSSLSPKWNPSGTKIAFVHIENNGPGTLWVMDANGNNARAILPVDSSVDPRKGVGNFDWSPDGERLAFASGQDGYCGILLSSGSSSECSSSIYIINLDGTGLKRLTYRWHLATSLTWIE
jgi:TolB protein